MQVDPDNRLVADQLEADWNSKLRSLRSLQEEYEKQKEAHQKVLSAEQRQKVLALAADFPKVWNDAGLAHRERKRVARLLLEDVTLRKEDKILVQVRFKGGALRTLELSRPLPHCEATRTKPEVIAEIDHWLGEHTHDEIVDLLNGRGFRSGTGRAFSLSIVGRICKDSGLKSRRQRLREAGLLTLEEMSRQARVTQAKIVEWRQAGRLVGQRSNYRSEYLYPPATPALIAKLRTRKKHANTTS
jgi:hypothetical protein